MIFFFFFFCVVHNSISFCYPKAEVMLRFCGFVYKKWGGKDKRAQLNNPGKVARRQQEMQWSGKIIRNSNLSSSLYSLIILVVITLRRN